MAKKGASEFVVPEPEFRRFCNINHDPDRVLLRTPTQPKKFEEGNGNGQGQGQEPDDQGSVSLSYCSIISNAPSSPLCERLREFDGLLIRRKRKDAAKDGKGKGEKNKGGILGPQREEKGMEKQGQGQGNPDDVFAPGIAEDSDEFEEYYDASADRFTGESSWTIVGDADSDSS